MILTIGKLKEIIKDLNDDIVLADLEIGNDDFEKMTGIKRLILLEEKDTGKQFLTINRMGSHFTGRGNQKNLKYADLCFD